MNKALLLERYCSLHQKWDNLCSPISASWTTMMVTASTTNNDHYRDTNGSNSGSERPPEKRQRYMTESMGLDLRVQGKDPMVELESCLLYTSPSPRDRTRSRMPSSA